MDFLQRIDQLAKAKGIKNRAQLAEKSGIPYTTLDNLYRLGYENVKLTTLRKLADCLGCSLDYLVYGEEKTRPQLSRRVEEMIQRDEKYREIVELLAMMDESAMDPLKKIAEEIVRMRDQRKD